MSTLAPPSPSLFTPDVAGMPPGAMLRGESFASARSYFSAESGSFITAASSPSGLASQPMSRTPSFTAPPRPSLGTSRTGSYSMGSTASRPHSASYFPPASRASSRLTLPPSRASSSLFAGTAASATSAPSSPAYSPAYSPLPHISVSAAPPAPLASRPSVSTRPSFSPGMGGPDTAVVPGTTPAQPTAPGRPRFLDLPSRTHSAAAVSPSVAAADTPVVPVAGYPVSAATAAAMDAPSANPSPAPTKVQQHRKPPAPSPHLMMGHATAATPWSAPPTASNSDSAPSPVSAARSHPEPGTPLHGRSTPSPHRRDALPTLATPDIPPGPTSPSIPAVPPSTAAILNPQPVTAPRPSAPRPADLCARLERSLERSLGRIVDTACHVDHAADKDRLPNAHDGEARRHGARTYAAGRSTRTGGNPPSRLH